MTSGNSVQDQSDNSDEDYGENEPTISMRNVDIFEADLPKNTKPNVHAQGQDLIQKGLKRQKT